MSFKINGETWEPKTAVEHADLIIDKINQLLQENNVTDKDGNIVGYSCDLDKALAAVNRQVRMIQQRYGEQKVGDNVATQERQPVASGPALDTPSSGGVKQGNAKPQFKSIEEAMEWEQDQILAKMRK